MQIFTIALGSLGDTYPLLMLSKILQQRGHDVTFFATADIEPHAQRYQIPFYRILEHDYNVKIKQLFQEGAKPVRLTNQYLVKEPLPAVYAGMQAVLAQTQTLTAPMVLCSMSSSHVGRCVADVFGMPTTVIHYAPIGLMAKTECARVDHADSLNHLPQFMRALSFNLMVCLFLTPTIMQTINQFRRQHGLKKVSVLDIYEWVNSGYGSTQPVTCLSLFPKWFSRPLTAWDEDRPMKGIPENNHFLHFPLNDNTHDNVQLPDAVITFLQRHLNPVVLTFGTRAENVGEIFAVAQQALMELSQPAIFLCQYANACSKDLPEFILYCDYAPLQLLLQYASVCVSHGGIGTVSQAMAAGVPQIIRPGMGDQYDNAARVTCMGIGVELPAQHFTVAQFKKVLKTVLSDTKYQLRNQEVRQLMQGAGQEVMQHAAAIMESAESASFPVRYKKGDVVPLL